MEMPTTGSGGVDFRYDDNSVNHEKNVAESANGSTNNAGYSNGVEGMGGAADASADRNSTQGKRDERSNQNGHNQSNNAQTNQKNQIHQAISSGSDSLAAKPTLESLIASNPDKLTDFIHMLVSEFNLSPEDAETSKLLDIKRLELEAMESMMNFKQLQIDTKELLETKNIPTIAVDLVVGSNIEETKKNISIFEKIFNEAVQIQVTNRLAGRSPERGNGSSFASDKGNSTSREEIRRIMNK